MPNAWLIHNYLTGGYKVAADGCKTSYSLLAKLSASDSFLFLLLGLYDVSDVAHDEYGRLRRTAPSLSTCCSNLLFVRDSQSEESGLKGSRKETRIKINVRLFLELR